MAMYEEACRFRVQLFTDILADLDEASTALAVLARLGVVTALDARQFRRQRLATRAFACQLRWCLNLDLAFDLRQVSLDRFVEQQTLLTIEHFASLAKADPAVIRQLQRLCLDLEILLGQQCLLSLNQRPCLRQHGGIDIGTSKFVEQVHGQEV